MNTTYSTYRQESLTLEDLKKAADMCYERTDPKAPAIPLLDRIMARFGYHRRYEVIVIDKTRFNYY